MPYLADILPEDADSTFDPESDLLEVIANEGMSSAAFSMESAEATLTYSVKWKKARSFLRWMLGFSYADNGEPYKLRRENPQIHPRFPWLTAATVSFSDHVPKYNDESGDPGPTYEGGDPLNPKLTSGAPNYPAAIFDPNGIVKTGFYEKTYATVRFVQRPWIFRPDSAISTYSDEVYRNVVWDVSPQVEMLSAEGPLGQLKWTETGTGGPTIGQPIPAAFGTLVPKATYALTWMWVPEEYLSNDEFAFFPAKMLDPMGKANSVDFGTFTTATGLIMPPKFQRFQFPIVTYDGLPYFGYNVTIPIVYFQPRPRGATSPSDDGYRLLPWPSNLKWYSAKRADNTTYLYQEADFNKIFQHIDDPS